MKFPDSCTERGPLHKKWPGAIFDVAQRGDGPKGGAKDGVATKYRRASALGCLFYAFWG